MEDGSTTSRRRRPLYTCGASTLAVIWNVYKRVLEIDGLIGLVARRLAKVGSRASPLICVIQYQWLTTLSFIDGYILSIEKIVENYVPLTRHVFDKIDGVVDKVDNIPMDFEHLVDKLLGILNKISIFDSTKEKEIRVDTRSNATTSRGKNDAVVVSAMKCSYKEALEKGVKDDKDNEGKKDGVEDDCGTKNEKNGNDDNVGKQEDPLLELLDYGWETPRVRLTMSRSASYT
ncbi:hypothetical protein RND81_02G245700 [Saponaria officinalis]